MRQRVMIAMALALEPALIIADEPTTALDVTVQAQILELLGRMQKDFQTAVILITHDLGVVADVADDVVIMYAGRPMERADVEAAFIEPHHPYTQGLLQSIPSYSGRSGRLRPIKGYPPSLMREIEECPFAARCPLRARRVPVGAAAAQAGGTRARATCRRACLPSDRVGRRRRRRGPSAAGVQPGSDSAAMTDTDSASGPPTASSSSRWTTSSSTSRCSGGSFVDRHAGSGPSGRRGELLAARWARRSGWSARAVAASRPWPA